MSDAMLISALQNTLRRLSREQADQEDAFVTVEARVRGESKELHEAEDQEQASAAAVVQSEHVLDIFRAYVARLSRPHELGGEAVWLQGQQEEAVEKLHGAANRVLEVRERLRASEGALAKLRQAHHDTVGHRERVRGYLRQAEE